MIPYGFAYLAPTSLSAVLAALAEDPAGTVLLAGGSWVVPSLGRGDRVARTVVDLRLAGLAGVTVTDGQVRLGACTTYAQLAGSTALAAAAPVLPLMAEGVTGGPQIIRRCTIGGAAVAARPSSDAPAALRMLDAVAEVAGPAGTRSLPVCDLWPDAFTTTLSPGEVLVAFRFAPLAAGTGCGYVKLKHSTGSWPIVTAAASIELAPDGVCRHARLAIGGAGRVPFIVPLADILLGRPVDDAALRAASHAAAAALTHAWDDELAPAAYRAAVTPVAAGRALTAALTEARAATTDRATEDREPS
jgi:aerobic carbon-monoxide dehydrogenase medium subunit